MSWAAPENHPAVSLHRASVVPLFGLDRPLADNLGTRDEMVVPLPRGGGRGATGGGFGDFSVSAPLVLQLDGREVVRSLLKFKRVNGITTLGLA